MISPGDAKLSQITTSFSLGGPREITARPVFYEVIALALGDGARAALGPAFPDAHSHLTAAGGRLVAGYLGMEAERDGTVRITSHGRTAGVISAVGAAQGIRIERTRDTAWPDGGFAVIGTEVGTFAGERDGSLLCHDENILFYLVHGPARAKVDERIVDLRARATLFGHSPPLERA